MSIKLSPEQVPYKQVILFTFLNSFAAQRQHQMDDTKRPFTEPGHCPFKIKLKSNRICNFYVSIYFIYLYFF